MRIIRTWTGNDFFIPKPVRAFLYSGKVIRFLEKTWWSPSLAFRVKKVRSDFRSPSYSSSFPPERINCYYSRGKEIRAELRGYFEEVGWGEEYCLYDTFLWRQNGEKKKDDDERQIKTTIILWYIRGAQLRSQESLNRCFYPFWGCFFKQTSWIVKILGL